jgi:hypothetical protein
MGGPQPPTPATTYDTSSDVIALARKTRQPLRRGTLVMFQVRAPSV